MHTVADGHRYSVSIIIIYFKQRNNEKVSAPGKIPTHEQMTYIRFIDHVFHNSGINSIS